MFYVQLTQSWGIDKKNLPSKPPAANAASNIPPPVSPAIPEAIPTSTSVTDPNKAGEELAVAYYTHQIYLTMQGVASSMRDA
jgi:hypothetical protein